MYVDIKMNLCEHVNWVEFAENRVHWRAFMSTVMDFKIP
jgi:hypothetical protein